MQVLGQKPPSRLQTVSDRFRAPNLRPWSMKTSLPNAFHGGRPSSKPRISPLRGVANRKLHGQPLTQLPRGGWRLGKIRAGCRPHPSLSPSPHRPAGGGGWAAHSLPPSLPTKKKKVDTKNHSTQDSHVVPHHGTNWAALRLTAQIGRDAVLSESYGRGYWYLHPGDKSHSHRAPRRSEPKQTGGARCPQGARPLHRGPALKRRANKGKKEEEFNRKVKQIFRTRA